MPLHPDATDLLALLASLDQPPIETQDPDTVRAARAALVRPSEIELHQIRDLDADGVPVRLYRDRPAEAITGLVVWYHGGGWVLGSVDSHDDLCRSICRASGHAVLSVEYRLAPEHPFPAGLDDAITATRWAYDHAEELGADPDRLAIGGDSAGANLAAVIAQDPPCRLRHQILVYPATDGRFISASLEENGDGLFLTSAGMRWFLDHYLSGGEGSPTDPRVSPALADPAAIAASPPTTVITAEFDPLRDEGIAYARQLAESGVPTSHVLFHGQIHGFVSMPEFIRDAHAARALIAAQVVTALGELPR